METTIKCVLDDGNLNYIKVEMRACFGLSEEQVSNQHDTVVKTFLKNHWHLIDEDGDNRNELKSLEALKVAGRPMEISKSSLNSR